jgi:hypothetical protein
MIASAQATRELLLAEGVCSKVMLLQTSLPYCSQKDRIVSAFNRPTIGTYSSNTAVPTKRNGKGRELSEEKKERIIQQKLDN